MKRSLIRLAEAICRTILFLFYWYLVWYNYQHTENKLAFVVYVIISVFGIVFVAMTYEKFRRLPGEAARIDEVRNGIYFLDRTGLFDLRNRMVDEEIAPRLFIIKNVQGEEESMLVTVFLEDIKISPRAPQETRDAGYTPRKLADLKGIVTIQIENKKIINITPYKSSE